MRKTALADRDLAICARLREARERLGLTQDACARAIGIERGSLLNYERAGNPIRFEMALRFCRRLIISEEWLATGEHGIMHAILKTDVADTPESWRTLDREILFRQCMDLGAEPEARSIRPRTLFSVAYEETLRPVYAELALTYRWAPRIVFSDAVPEKDLCIDYSGWLDARIFRMLAHAVPPALGKSPWGCLRQMLAAVFEVRETLFMHYRDNRFDEASLRGLVEAVNELSDSGVLSRIAGGRAHATATSSTSEVDNIAKREKSDVALAMLSYNELVSKASALTSAYGMKKFLAEFMGVTPQQLSKYLSGIAEPSGESTLRMLAWVKSTEASINKPAAPLKTARRKARNRKSNDEKTVSDPPRK
jgi:transcriptional regulator with XRE-family HTH domain